MGQADLLVRSAGLLVIVLAFAAAALVVAYLVAIWAALRTWDLVLKGFVDYLYKAPRWFQGTIIGVGMAAFIIRVVGLVIGLRGWTLLMFAPVVIYLIGGFVGRTIWGRKTGRPPIEVRNAATQEWRRLGSLFRRVWRGTATVFAALVLLLALAVITNSAHVAAEAVHMGQAYRDWTVPWRADPASVRWLMASPADDPLSGRCLMYLGQANASLVFYDVDSRRILRVPSTEVVLLVNTAARSCRS